MERGSRWARRSFLAAAGLAGAGAMTQTGGRGKLRTLLAEGVVVPETIVGRQPLTLPPDLVAALQAGAQVRIRVEYPVRKDLAMYYASSPVQQNNVPR